LDAFALRPTGRFYHAGDCRRKATRGIQGAPHRRRCTLTVVKTGAVWRSSIKRSRPLTEPPMAQRRQASLTEPTRKPGCLHESASCVAARVLQLASVRSSARAGDRPREWLREAGPGGAVLPLLSAQSVMMLIALCYGELAGGFSEQGRNSSICSNFRCRRRVHRRLVPDAYAIAACAFEGIALGWVCRAMWPQLDLARLIGIRRSSVMGGDRHRRRRNRGGRGPALPRRRLGDSLSEPVTYGSSSSVER